MTEIFGPESPISTAICVFIDAMAFTMKRVSERWTALFACGPIGLEGEEG